MTFEAIQSLLSFFLKRFNVMKIETGAVGDNNTEAPGDYDDNENNASSTHHHHHQAKSSPADDLICPITRELPWNPVTAEDGRIYDEDAIKKHIRICEETPGRKLVSPYTNVEMGPRLLPSHQIRNLIEKLVANGIIQGDLAEVWNEKVEVEKKKKEKLLQKANNLDAMYKLALNYYDGLQGFPTDYEQSYHWAKKGHVAGNVMCTAHLGLLLVTGEGCNKLHSNGSVLLAIAAGQGSNLAAYTVGMAYAKGKFGLSFNNRDEAIRWLKKVVQDEWQYDHLAKVAKEKAKVELDKLMGVQVTP